MRSEYFGSLVKLIIFAIFAVTVVNDAGSVLLTHYRIGDQCERVAKEALRNYNLYNQSPDQALMGAKLKAQQDGAILTGFQITEHQIRVSVKIPAKTTWVAHRIQRLKPYLHAEGQHDLSIK